MSVLFICLKKYLTDKLGIGESIREYYGKTHKKHQNEINLFYSSVYSI